MKNIEQIIKRHSIDAINVLIVNDNDSNTILDIKRIIDLICSSFNILVNDIRAHETHTMKWL